MASEFGKGAILAGLLVGLTLAVSAGAGAKGGELVISIIAPNKTSVVARQRLTGYLQRAGCEAEVVIGDEPAGAGLVYRPGIPPPGEVPQLVSVNRLGKLPQPAWISRRTAGVRSLSELEGRDLAIISGTDPVGRRLPLEALAEAGVVPARDQLYETGDYSSSLGLVLHNNTHAAASEAGFVDEMLEPNDLVVIWAGEPFTSGGWYRGTGWDLAGVLCEDALAAMKRSDDRQIFAVFPEWVHGFIRPEGLDSEEVSK
ncbi:PhnD/SsuA/transferrin family substrate-binding protein [Marinobacter salinexigens]|uniref:PhnD/SsuA/transferrin family substrate-binding protein n=1 Tax=Marinobacter salinexigens TaxID=2919747 RepID=UPI00165F023E|nr:PhnD/SsuA/transferrin family substrate-binding protein [Marinobacter salinexigens]